MARRFGEPDGANHYNTRVMLLRIRDSLQLLEDHYRRTEGDNAALWGKA